MKILGMSVTTIILFVLVFYLGTRYPNAFGMFKKA